VSKREVIISLKTVSCYLRVNINMRTLEIDTVNEN
jgi:hypothetical protein